MAIISSPRREIDVAVFSFELVVSKLRSSARLNEKKLSRITLCNELIASELAIGVYSFYRINVVGSSVSGKCATGN